MRDVRVVSKAQCATSAGFCNLFSQFLFSLASLTISLTHRHSHSIFWFQAQFNASQLITQRELVSRRIRQILTERASDFNISLDDVSIVSHEDLVFPSHFLAYLCVAYLFQVYSFLVTSLSCCRH